MKEAVRQRARALGFDECRFTTAEPPESASIFQRWLASSCHGEMAYLARNAAKRADPQRVLPGAATVISLAANYQNRPDAPPEPEKGLIAQYARYADYHDVLRGGLEQLTAFVNATGGEGSRSLWYVDTGPLLERALAQRAGLGFVGKHTNLVSRRLGNFFFLCEIITTVRLAPDTPEKNRCGSCVRCLAACPTGAIQAPFHLDARLCISYLTIELKGPIPEPLRPAIGNRIFGCDACLAVCLWNRFAREATLLKSFARPELESPHLLELLALDEAEFDARFRGTPLQRGKRRGLLRNVCVALGNIGDETALVALDKAADSQDPLIAEHARWAIDQIRGRVARRDE
ncbi:MAG TPA: tRNA epoxyqueuosine(34) reductase QueG [Verrucomicrobiae bacterium]